MSADVYLFGQILGTHSFLLRGGFLQPDACSEIEAQDFLPGDETSQMCLFVTKKGAAGWQPPWGSD